MNQHMKKEFGFTLIELMIVIAIAGVAIALGVPMLGNYARDSRLTTTTNGVVLAVNYARSEAVKRTETVSLCPSTDQVSCAGGTDWSIGWIVWVDESDDRTVDAGETILRVGDAVDGSISIDTAAATALTFDTDGSLSTPNTATFTVEPSGCTGTERRTISVNLSGRPRTSEVSC